jgi:hypothetical protein
MGKTYMHQHTVAHLEAIYKPKEYLAGCMDSGLKRFIL